MKYRQNKTTINESLPVIYLPRGVWDRLARIATTMGLPSQILGEAAITRWVLLNWDLKKDKPISHNSGVNSDV